MKTEIFGYKGGTFYEEDIREAKEKNIPLTLDMAIPGDCLNRCIFCGYKDTQKGKKLSFNEIKRIIKEFSDLGGKSIAILGEGEPLLRKDILEIFEHIRKKGMQPILFTCGDVLGDDDLCKKIHGISGQEFVRKLDKIGLTVVLKYDAKNQDKIVQRKGYSAKRNKALKRLIEHGFNQHQPTRLGFGIVVLDLNYQEIPSNYKWAIKNNIYPLLCPLMPIGKAGDPCYRGNIGITQEQIADLSVRLYKIAINEGIKIKDPADFIGGLPCDIARAGFYIADTGDIYVCEAEEKIGNIRRMSLNSAWGKIRKIKDKKYKDCRWDGFCYEKRKQGILPKNLDKLVKKGIDEF